METRNPLSRASVFILACAIPLALLAGCSTAGRLLDHGQSQPPADDPGRAAMIQRLEVLRLPVAPRAPGTHYGSQKAPAHSNASDGAVVSPDKAWIAFESDKDGVHGVWIARPDGDQAHRVSGRRSASLPRWSPDGKSLVFLARTAKRDDWGVWVVDVPDGTPRKLTSTASGSIAGFSWFPDSRHLCYGNREWLIVVDSSEATTRAFRMEDDSSRIVGIPAVSPDGRSIVFAVAGDGAWMASMRDGSLTQVIAEQEVDAFAWAPGGSQFAFRIARDGQWKVQVVRTEK